MHSPLALGFIIVSLIAIAITPLAAVAQPLMRQTRDIRMLGGSSLPGMLAVTLVRDRSRSIRYLDLAQGRVLEFPSPVANAGNPSFSPDGRYIAFAHDPRGTLSYEIKAARLSDKRIFPIAKAERGSLRYLSWSVARPYTVVGDLCPKDPNKMRPGQCGCGRSERDTDEDTVADCLDGCPRNPRKHRGRTCD